MDHEALDKLIELGLLPEEPRLSDPESTDCMVLHLQRTYGAPRDGRQYWAAVIGYRDFPDHPYLWTVSGGSPQTPRNVTWPEFLVWLTTPKKSKWRMWFATEWELMGTSRALNNELYKEERKP